MSFVDLLFPTNISYGAIGGPAFNTTIHITGSGREYRNANLKYPLGKWDVAHNLRTPAQKDQLIAFFRLMKGRFHTFRYFDWLDNTVAQADGYLGEDGIEDGHQSYQLQKVYTVLSQQAFGRVALPVSPITVYRDGSPIVTGFTVDYSTGLVTMDSLSVKTITGITKANPAVVTAVGHGFSTGDKIWIFNVGGMAQINDQLYTITVLTGDTFSLNGINSTAFSTYTSGGTAGKYPQTGQTLRWSGSFHRLCRFDIDEMKVEINPVDNFSWDAIPIVEVP